MGVQRVPNFPFPTPPEEAAVAAAERCLVSIMALDGKGCLTSMGKSMASLPVSPRHARMLLEVAGNSGAKDREAGSELLAYALALTAAMSVEQPFVHVSSIQDSDPAAAHARAHKSHQHFRSVGPSDGLAAMSALLAFESEARSAEWCVREALHFRHLHEAAALRRQLSRYLATSMGRTPQELLPTHEGGRWGMLAKPGTAITDALRRGTAAGWADQVAKRVKPWEQVQADTGGGRRNKAVRYHCALGDEEVYLHPNSAMHSTCPDFVVYKELVRTAKRPYMAVVTEVEASWLPSASPVLCKLSDALAEPPPSYRPQHDDVMAWHGATYGARGWELPPVLAPYGDNRLATAAFAAALLGGEVLPCCASLGPELAAPPKWAARPENQVCITPRWYGSTSASPIAEQHAVWVLTCDLKASRGFLVWDYGNSKLVHGCP